MMFVASPNSMGLRILVLTPVVIAVMLGEFQMLRATRAQYLQRSQGLVDLPEQFAGRLSPLKDVLPPYGEIGYIDPDHSWLNADATRAFYLTQYVLAPRILLYSTAPEYVIYSSHLGKPLTPSAIPAGMRVLSHSRPDLAVLIRSRW